MRGGFHVTRLTIRLLTALGSALHVFLSPELLQEVSTELLGADMGAIEIAPAFSVGDPALMPLLRLLEQALRDSPTEGLLKVDLPARVTSRRSREYAGPRPSNRVRPP